MLNYAIILIFYLQFRGVIDVHKEGLFKYDSYEEFIDVAFPLLNGKTASNADIPKIRKEWYVPAAEGIYQMCRSDKPKVSERNKWRKSLIAEFQDFDQSIVDNYMDKGEFQFFWLFCKRHVIM